MPEVTLSYYVDAQFVMKPIGAYIVSYTQSKLHEATLLLNLVIIDWNTQSKLHEATLLLNLVIIDWMLLWRVETDSPKVSLHPA